MERLYALEFPSEARVYHLGIFREKVSLQPVECEFLRLFATRAHPNGNSWASRIQDYSKLPKSPNVDQVFLLDPLIATGGTACAALAMLLDWGIPGKFFTFTETP